MHLLFMPSANAPFTGIIFYKNCEQSMQITTFTSVGDVDTMKKRRSLFTFVCLSGRAKKNLNTTDAELNERSAVKLTLYVQNY